VSVASMTGFARAGGQMDDVSWQWEVKSVNARGLDIRIRLAPGAEALEVPVRNAVGEAFSRGSFNINLTVTRVAASTRFSLNHELLDQLLSVVKEVEGRVKGGMVQIDGLLRVRGILEAVEDVETDEDKAKREAAMAASFTEALTAIKAARKSEGERLATVLQSQVDQIAELAQRSTKVASAQPAAIRDRLKAQMADLLAGSTNLSEERLAQEAAMLAGKADVREEIDRLNAHVSQARELIGGGGAVGRRLDFLSQEFNREANTLCSKAGDIELTRIGLDLKAVIEQFREQVQNVE
jgi:uncharacterized protein (TIGR00255 family)